MPESKYRKKGPRTSIEIHATDISVVRNRSAEPYIKSFIAAPENIAQESLGTLVGVFSVSEKSESSAYIVNTLASVAKKEYFANPRRGSIESFESTLHKMNIVLSELVKNGQTDWIGNLHGAIAAIEQYTIHFSVTGGGAILLFREESLSDIGNGLASEEARFHPLKTFVEISTGRLSAADYVLLTSPELLTLFDQEELKRSARRLGIGKKFSQFLETAMINELKAGAVVILEASEKLLEATETKKIRREKSRSKDTINAWSARAFEEKQREQSASFQDEVPAELAKDIHGLERVEEKEADSRFGEIYVRGEISEKHEEHPMITRCRWFFEDRIRQYEDTKKHLARGSKKTLSSLLEAVSRGTGKTMRRAKESIFLALKRKTGSFSHSSPQPGPRLSVKKTEKTGFSKNRSFLLPKIPTTDVRRKILSFLPQPNDFQTKGLAALNRARTGTGVAKRQLASLILALWNSRIVPLVSRARTHVMGCGIFLARSFRKQSPKRQIILMASMAFFLTLAVSALRNGKETGGPQETIVLTENTAVPSPRASGGEPEAAALVPIPVKETALLTPVFLKDRLYIVSERHIFDPETAKTYPLPDGASLKYAVGMSDLNLIFILAQDTSLYSFAPSNQSFVKNTIELPAGFIPIGLGSFLTYVYFLEKGTGTVYRFPRAEGGFGEGSTWTKEPFPKDTDLLAVSENIYGANDTSVAAFLKGRPSPQFSFERSSDPLSITALCANPDLPSFFAIVDAKGKRILLMNENGSIRKQIFSPSLEGAEKCSLDASGNTIAVSTADAVFTMKLE